MVLPRFVLLGLNYLNFSLLSEDNFLLDFLEADYIFLGGDELISFNSEGDATTSCTYTYSFLLSAMGGSVTFVYFATSFSVVVVACAASALVIVVSFPFSYIGNIHATTSTTVISTCLQLHCLVSFQLPFHL